MEWQTGSTLPELNGILAATALSAFVVYPSCIVYARYLKPAAFLLVLPRGQLEPGAVSYCNESPGVNALVSTEMKVSSAAERHLLKDVEHACKVSVSAVICLPVAAA